MKTFHKILAAFGAALALVSSAQAISIGRSGGGAGGARSIGMSRPSYTAPRPSYTAPRPTTVPSSYRAPAPVAPVNRPPEVGGGFGGGGGGFWSSFAGGAAGSAIGNLLTQPHHVSGVPVAGAAAPAAGGVPVTQGVAGYPGAAPVAYMAPTPSLGTLVLGGLLKLLAIIVVLALIGGVVYAVYLAVKAARDHRAAQKREAEEADTDPDELPFDATLAFVAIQRAFVERDLDALRLRLSPGMFEAVKDDLPEDGAKYSLRDIGFTVQYSSKFLVSVRFSFLDTDDNRRTAEVWDFKPRAGRWVLSGISH